MGTFTYRAGDAIDIDDVLLTHLEAIVVAKLRRSEPFLLSFIDADARSSLWIHVASNLMFGYSGSKGNALDRARLAAMIKDANRPAGLTLQLGPSLTPVARRP